MFAQQGMRPLLLPDQQYCQQERCNSLHFEKNGFPKGWCQPEYRAALAKFEVGLLSQEEDPNVWTPEARKACQASSKHQVPILGHSAVRECKPRVITLQS